MSIDTNTVIVVVALLLVMGAGFAIFKGGSFKAKFRGLDLDAKGPEKPSTIAVLDRVQAKDTTIGPVMGAASPAPGADVSVMNDAIFQGGTIASVTGVGAAVTPEQAAAAKKRVADAKKKTDAKKKAADNPADPPKR